MKVRKMRILLSRTDSIGDVMLTLPMAGVIKKAIPGSHITFIGRTYTKDLIACCSHVDDFINRDELLSMEEDQAVRRLAEGDFDRCIHVFPDRQIGRLVRKAGIAVRTGTAGRFHHWLYCNDLVRFSRRRSELHEAQLNLILLKLLSIQQTYRKDELDTLTGFNKVQEASSEMKSMINESAFNLIIHPATKGSAEEWGYENFSRLIEILPEDRYRIFISGTEKDKLSIGDKLPFHRKNVVSIMGTFDLKQFISFISICDGMVAASTGPLHIAAALGKKAIGLYSSRKPIHPGRWAPLGKNSRALVYDENCPICASGKICSCIRRISPERVVRALEN